MPLHNRKTQYVGIAISLVLHLLLALLFILPESPVPPPLPSSQSVRIIPASALQKKQIVSESQGKESKDPVQSRLLAAKNITVEKQQIKRGQVDAGAAPGPKAAPAPQSKPAKLVKASKKSNPEKVTAKKKQPQKEAPRKKAPPAKKKNLAKRKLDLTVRPLSNMGIYKTTRQEKPEKTKPRKTKSMDFSAVQPFSRPPGSGARFLGLRGSSDYLPELPDGDLTLLNTKAQKYAVFVRRVALRVFSDLRQSGWESLARSDIMRISENSVVRVKMDATGQIKDMTLYTASGSRAFDRSVIQASKASKDPNPPSSALNEDKTLTLEFHARTWSQAMRQGPRGPVRERRWLFLGTALY